MPADIWSRVRRLLAIRLDNIGDVVLLGPALRSLREGLPGAHITLMASPAGSQVAPLLPWIDDVMVERVLWQDTKGTLDLEPARELALAAELRRRQFDTAIVFTSFSQSPYPPAFICYLAGIPVRLGQSKEFGGGVLSQWVRPLPDQAHQAERNLHLLQATGLAVAGTDLELAVPPEIEASAGRMLRSAGLGPEAPFIAMAPGASAEARRYEPERYARVAGLLLAKSDLPIVVLGSSRDAELAAPIIAEGRQYGPGRLVDLTGRTSVVELAAIIRQARLVIANDSGPMHFADAFNRPMVILYSGTEHESQWRPRRAPARLLRRPTECSPCYAFRCPYHMECLDIPAEEVAGEVMQLLDQTADLANCQGLPGTGRYQRAASVESADARP